jgi:hypothetical protein
VVLAGIDLAAEREENTTQNSAIPFLAIDDDSH